MTKAGLMHVILDYELRCSRRYRRFITVVAVSWEGRPCSFADLVGGVIRGSDTVLDLNCGAMILMGDTSVEGALNAISRYGNACRTGTRLRFGVAAYPQDAQDATQLLNLAKKRLEKAPMWGFTLQH